MKYEPLKGKERVIQYIGNIRRMDGGIHRIPFIKRGFLTDDVKSAVQGLLEEIENTDLLVLEELDFIDRNNLDPEEIVVNTLEYVKWLIKKWLQV